MKVKKVRVKVRSVERIVVIVIIMKQMIFVIMVIATKVIIVMMTIIMITVMKVKKVRSVERNVERFAVGIVVMMVIDSSDEIDIMVMVATVLLLRRNKEAVIMILSKHISRI